MSQALAHIVDDDEAIRDALTWLFRTRQVACRAWESAEAFLEAWQPDWRGCIVLDIRMREMSGLECFEALREQGNSLPVIFLTGHGDVPMAVGALKKGAFDFLEKPVDDNALVDRVIRATRTPTSPQPTINKRWRRKRAGKAPKAFQGRCERRVKGEGKIVPAS